MIRAAGLLIQRRDGRVLLLRRSAEGDAEGQWCTPGGKIEEGESPLDAAIRETMEEIGCDIASDKDKLKLWSRRIGRSNTDAPEVDYTTFLLQGIDDCTPKLNEEHTEFDWFDPATPPANMHVGCTVPLQRLIPEYWNELKHAEAIRDGWLTSPQQYENLWLFDIRITSTGRAFRSEKKDAEGRVIHSAEVVWRDKSLYLNPEFLARCNGLPVILEHPASQTLNSEEFQNRIVGTVLLPYIRDDEVWGIAKILDQSSALMMSEHQLSTSPAVVWEEPKVNQSGEFEDGTKFFIEGKPSLLDHIAICRQGVWDKGGDPSGVKTVRGDDVMPDDNKDNNKQMDRIDKLLTGLGDQLQTLNARVDSAVSSTDLLRRMAKRHVERFKFSSRADGEELKTYLARLDAEEEELKDEIIASGDPEEMAADKSKSRRRDAEEENEKKPAFLKDKKDDADEDDKDKKDKKDDADEDDKDKKPAFLKKDDADEDDKDDDKKDKKADRKDSLDMSKFVPREDFDKLMSRLDAVSDSIAPVKDEDLNAIGKVLSRADSVYIALGQNAPRHRAGESILGLRRRIAADLKQHTKWKDAEMSLLAADEATFTRVEDEIYKESLDFARSPARVPAGELRMTTTRLDSGHTMHEFHGESGAWMNTFAGPVRQFAKSFRTDDAKKQ